MKIGDVVYCRVLSQYVGGYVDIPANVTMVLDNDTLNLMLEDEKPAYGQKMIVSDDPHIVMAGWHHEYLPQTMYGLNLRSA